MQVSEVFLYLKDLAETVRPEILCETSGDEVVFTVPGGSPGEAEILAGRLKAAHLEPKLAGSSVMVNLGGQAKSWLEREKEAGIMKNGKYISDLVSWAVCKHSLKGTPVIEQHFDAGYIIDFSRTEDEELAEEAATSLKGVLLKAEIAAFILRDNPTGLSVNLGARHAIRGVFSLGRALEGALRA